MMAVDQQEMKVPMSLSLDDGVYGSWKVDDDGMSPIICKNDEIIIKQQQIVENGELAVVTIGDDDTPLLRRVYYNESGAITLTCDNARVAPLVFDTDETATVHIHGKVLYLMREITHGSFTDSL